MFSLIFTIGSIASSNHIFSASTKTNDLIPDSASGIKLQEITVTGSASLDQDLELLYKVALADAFHKAYAKFHPQVLQNPAENGQSTADSKKEKDLITLEKELGISDYQILRYWSAEGQFNLELKIVFDDSQIEQPRLNSLGHFPKLDWVYESAEQIKTVNKTNLGLAVSTTRTIEIIATNNGKRLQLIKTELKPHEVSGGQYMVEEGGDIKVIELNKHNISKIIYKWNKKLPGVLNHYLGKEALYVIDKTGVIRAFNWENGAELWQLPASKQALIRQLNREYLSMTVSATELWIVNIRGEKLWAKRFGQNLAAAPVAGDKELYCLFKNNELKVFDLETGGNISTWKIKHIGDIRNIYLGISGKRLFLSYNDTNGHGYLRAYHRFTGDLLWETSREKTITDSLIVTPVAVVIGVGNTIEARDPRFGLKLWEEPVYGLVTKIFWIDDTILAVAGNRLYRYNY